MAVEHYPISLVSERHIDAQTKLIPQGYYRSKLFIAPFSTNALVAAAGPLLSLLERLCLSPSLPPLENIRSNIEHELLAFQSKMDASKYPADFIVIAHYLMSATIDELLGKNYMRVNHVAAEFKAFTPFTSGDSQPQERFFEILNYIKDRPNQYLDLIELIYFLLIVGFEGKYHLNPTGRQALDNYIEDLYHIIQQNRFNQPHRFFSENPIPKIVKKNNTPIILTVVTAVALVALTFFVSHYLLENKAKNVLFGHSNLALLDMDS